MLLATNNRNSGWQSLKEDGCLFLKEAEFWRQCLLNRLSSIIRNSFSPPPRSSFNHPQQAGFSLLLSQKSQSSTKVITTVSKQDGREEWAWLPLLMCQEAPRDWDGL